MIKKISKAILIVVLILFLLSIIFDVDIVNGNSMSPTINNGSVVISISHFNKISVDDIIQFKIDDEYYIKRVVAIDGDIISIYDGRVEINGIQPDNCFANKDDNIYIALSHDEYYTLGDNRLNSVDSRDFGPISKDMVTGKIVLVLK